MFELQNIDHVLTLTLLNLVTFLGLRPKLTLVSPCPAMFVHHLMEEETLATVTSSRGGSVRAPDQPNRSMDEIIEWRSLHERA